MGGKTSSVHIGQLVVNCSFAGTVCRLKPWRSSVSSFLSFTSSFTPCFSSFSPSVALLSFWISFLCSTASTCNSSSLSSNHPLKLLPSVTCSARSFKSACRMMEPSSPRSWPFSNSPVGDHKFRGVFVCPNLIVVLPQILLVTFHCQDTGDLNHQSTFVPQEDSHAFVQRSFLEDYLDPEFCLPN